MPEDANNRGSEEVGAALPGVQELVRDAPWICRLNRRRDLRRLASAIDFQQVRLEYYKKLRDGSGADDRAGPGEAPPEGQRPPAEQADLVACKRLLHSAKESLRACDIDSGWRAVQALEREMLPMLTDSELHARWISAMLEAKEKVGDWRGLAAEKLAEGFSGDREGSVAALRETLVHIHVRSQNVHYKNAQVRKQITWAAAFVTILVFGTLALSWLGFFILVSARLAETLPLAVFSGLLGGVLSVAFSVVRADPTRRIPEVRSSFAILMVRPVVGAAIALPILFFLEAGLIVDQAHQWIVLALCFVGGFSERWFLGIVERVEGRT